MPWRNRFSALLAVGLLLVSRAGGEGGWLRLGLGQEFGRDGRISSEGRTGSDLYSETILRLGLSHPVLFLDGKGVFNPVIGLSYSRYRDFTELDTVGFDLSGPLTLQFQGLGDESDSLRLSAGVSRDTGAVSTWNTTRATSTLITADALYTRHWGSPRWTSELGYRYYQRTYADAEYQDRDSTTHTVSAAVLYALNRDVRAGLRTSYLMEDFDSDTRLDSDTWDISALVRWQITGKVRSEFSLGHEMVWYATDEDDSGVTVRGALDYQVTARWHCAAVLGRYMEPAETPGSTGETTTTGSLRISYQFTPKLSGSLSPGISTRTGDNQTTEVSLGAEMTYAFRLFDLTALTRVTRRDSDRGGDDSYTAVDAAVRFEWASDRQSGGQGDLRARPRRRVYR